MRSSHNWTGGLILLLLVCPAAAWGQGAYGPQPQGPVMGPMVPGGPPAGYPPQTAPAPPGEAAQQRPAQYGFRPDLTNPQFGQCLRMEKEWQALWHRYNALYHQHRSMNPADPQYQQLTHYMYTLRQQLDMAWQSFSSQCIYFPSRR